MALLRPTIRTLVDVFGPLPEDCLSQLQGIFFERRFRAGEKIFWQNEEAESLHLVVEGRVKVERVTTEGHQCILCLRGPSDFFCPVPLLDRGRQLGTAWALTPVVVLSAEMDAFRRVASAYPQLLAIVQQGCLFEVRRLLGRMELYAFRSVRERVASMLLEESRKQERYGGSLNEVRITHQELAGLVGASRESVSRSLAELEEEGIVKTGRGRVTILDRARLEEKVLIRAS